jgi:hypothetical protein
VIVTGRKCNNVNWEGVCKPKEYGGLWILNLPKFSTTLCMRWLWQEWNHEAKPWVGLGTPCTPQDMDLFAAATEVRIGNGEKISLLGGSLLKWKAP